MTVSTIRSTAALRTAAFPRLDTIPAVVLVLMPLALLMSWPRAVTVWQTGAFFDSDDALRMVEVRAWLAGQGWYDLVAHRLVPPAGLPMHWSRVVDIAVGTLVQLFGLIAEPTAAERLARLAFPLALQGAMIAATAWVARLLAGRDAALPAGLLLLLGGICFGQFQPGRIDHHAPQILLLMLSLGTTLRSLDPKRANLAALTGGLIALSLAVSLENLPFFAVLLAVPPVAWAIGGQPFRRLLVWFALGLGLALPGMLLATVAPERLLVVTPDALSIGHVAALGSGSLGLLILAVLSPRLPTTRGRWLAALLAGIAALGLVATACPGLLRGPYGTMDPFIERLWLSQVQEAQPLTTVLHDKPEAILLLLGPLLAGVIAIAAAVVRRRGVARGRWLVVLALVGVGCAGALWESRVAGTVVPLALLGGAWVVARALDLARRGPALRALLPVGALMLFSAAAWAVVPVPSGTAQRPEDLASAAACRDPAAFAPLARLPAVTAFAPVDTGSYILVHTRLSAIGAPYHRNQAGNLLVLRALLAPPAAARPMVEGSGAKLILACPGNHELRIAADLEPEGLAAALLADRVPDWLTAEPLPGTPYRVYRVDGDPQSPVPGGEQP